MPTIISTNPNRAIDLTGRTVPGALATFYEAGTTSERTVYADPDCNVPHPTPLQANGAGVFPPVFDVDDTDVSVTVTNDAGVTLPGYPINMAMKIGTDATGAGGVAFSPTAEIPKDNVQDAIEQVQANIVAPLAEFGLGVTGNAELLADINGVNIASGVYRYDGATGGTFPAGVVKGNGGIVRIWRENSSSALMILTENGGTRQFVRAQAGGWEAWRKIMSDIDTASNSIWATGTATTPYVVSPANVAASVAAQAIGVGQTWKTPARVLGTAYTNSTGRPIYISVTVNGAPGNPGVIDVRSHPGGVWVTASLGNADVGTFSAIIPAGHQYRALGGDGLIWWAELS